MNSATYQPVFHRILSSSLMLGTIWAATGGEPGAEGGKLDSFDTLRDPTVLNSAITLGTEYANQDGGNDRYKLNLSGTLAFGAAGAKDWSIGANLPYRYDDPGAGAKSTSGVGDLKIAVGHVFDGLGRFRWGLGLATTFDTASKVQFGDGATTLSPVWGGGFRFTSDFELVGNVQYNVSVQEAAGRSPIHSLEIRPALLKTWPRDWYSLAGWESTVDFQDGEAHYGKMMAEVGKAFGARQQWVVYAGFDVPVVRAGRDNFSINAGLSYVFQ